jgi:hypothetical protein
VDDIAATGANTLTVVVTAYQSSEVASAVRTDPQLTPRPEVVSPMVLRARQTLGMKACIKLHVDVDSGGWRGNIDPADPAEWFDSYRAFVFAWAAEAEADGVEQFVFGTELGSTLDHEDHWRRLIRDLRALFSGEIVYAASWDEAPLVPFWDAVDVMGIDFYAPVSSRDDPHRIDLLRGWQDWISRIRIIHKITGRDVLLTEIGYRSVDGAGRHPYDFSAERPVDLAEQADLYWAALEALADRPWVRGVYWWNWLANGDPEAEVTDYTPRGKPAETELRNAWQ